MVEKESKGHMTIEITADTTGFDKSIDKCIARVKELEEAAIRFMEAADSCNEKLQAIIKLNDELT